MNTTTRPTPAARTDQDRPVPERTGRDESTAAADAATVTRPGRRRLVRLGAVVAAAAAGLVVWLLAVPLAGVELTARQGPTLITVGPVAVGLAGLVAALGGWVVLAALERFVGRPKAVWTVVALVVMVLSLGSPIVQASSPAAAVTLVALHLVVGVTVIAVMRPTARPRR